MASSSASPSTGEASGSHASTVPQAATRVKAKPKAKAKSPAMPRFNILRFVCTSLARRGCRGLNTADEIVRVGLAEALQRGFVPCRLCYRSRNTDA